jgi:peptide chain release factor subunit 1
LLVEASEDVLAEQEATHERKLMEKFFFMLGKEREKTAYGKDEVEKALNFGAVETLILSKKLPKQEIKEYEKRAEEISAEVKIVSVDTGEGKQFWNLGGIGAILRFKIKG